MPPARYFGASSPVPPGVGNIKQTDTQPGTGTKVYAGPSLVQLGQACLEKTRLDSARLQHASMPLAAGSSSAWQVLASTESSIRLGVT